MFFLSTAVAIAVAGLWSSPASAQSRQMVYKVEHSTYGDIGTYSNVVTTSGDTTTVKTSVHLAVKMLGVVMHREDDERTEQWQNNRLVAFHGVTDKNGKTIEVNGQAHDDQFIITTPSGTYAAPASVHPANPWSAAALQSTTMMQVDTGKVGPVKVLGGKETTVEVGGATRCRYANTRSTARRNPGSGLTSRASRSNSPSMTIAAKCFSP